MIKANIRYWFLRAFILMLFVSSCSLEEDLNLYNSGVIDFVVRHTDYNGKVVGTKSELLDDFENKIHNCYFMLFDDSGNLRYTKDLSENISQNATISLRLSDLEIGNYDSYTKSKACIIANIPANIVRGIKTLSNLEETVLNIDYSGEHVVDTDLKNSYFVIPEFDLDGNKDTRSVPCVPMFGMSTPFNLELAGQCEIPIKRLFAKVSVNISVTQNLATFDLLAAHLHNLPTQVSLVEPENPDSYESQWVKDDSKFLPKKIVGNITDDDIRAGAANVLSNSYKFYFYVPEYYLQPLSQNTQNYGNERFKPEMYDESKYPIYVKLFGTYNDPSILGNDVKADVIYDLYLGENASTSFTQKRNFHYTNNLTINGITNNISGSGLTLDCRVKVLKEEHDLIEIYGETANCYIIGKTGKYTYPACKGVFQGGLDNIPEEFLCSNTDEKQLTLEVVKNDKEGKIKIENLEYNTDSKEFSFEITDIPSSVLDSESYDGNIVLALTYTKDGKKYIEWSWHIWVIKESTILDGVFDVSTQTYPNRYILMDRNLGARPTLLQKATPGISNGLYYKYGCKEPYIDGQYCGGGESLSYTWTGETKSQTDPCPPGYRVPKAEVWRSIDGSNPTYDHSGVYGAFIYWNSYYYPYSGYIDADGNEQSVGNINPGNIETMVEVRLPHEQNPWGTTLSYGDLTRGDYPRKFMNVKYRVNDIDISGYTSARDEKLFKYWYKNKGYEIIECEYISGIWIESRKNIGTSWFPIYVSEYNASYSGNPIKLTGEQLSRDYPGEYDNLIQRIQIIKAGSVLENFLSGVQKEVSYSLDESVDKSYSYQIRCVRE